MFLFYFSKVVFNIINARVCLTVSVCLDSHQNYWIGCNEIWCTDIFEPGEEHTLKFWISAKYGFKFWLQYWLYDLNGNNKPIWLRREPRFKQETQATAIVDNIDILTSEIKIKEKQLLTFRLIKSNLTYSIINYFITKYASRQVCGSTFGRWKHFVFAVCPCTY